jgi:hypothetical protein
MTQRPKDAIDLIDSLETIFLWKKNGICPSLFFETVNTLLTMPDPRDFTPEFDFQQD